MSGPPVISGAEREATIERAITIRGEMDAVRAKLANGSLGLAEALNATDPGAAVNRLYVVKLLESLPQIGKVPARRLMSEIGIAEKCRVVDLDPSQRILLIAKIGQ
ncbi:MAG: integration host factor, actinobacterial type [Ilumatobacteraceae bacterium]